MPAKMVPFIRVLSLTAMLVCLGGTVGFQNAQVAPDVSPYVLPRSDVISVPPNNVHSGYKISVALPSGYEEAPTKSFPIVYVLDGDWYFGLTASMARLSEAVRESPPVIVVAIGFGGTLQDQRRRRAIEFTPAVETTLTGSGHAATFLAALRQSIIPVVESRYRVTPDRTPIGHSLGGLFAAFAMLRAPDVFRRVVIGSPALWSSEELIVSELDRALKQRHALPSHLFLGVSSGDGARIRASYKALTHTLNMSAPHLRWTSQEFAHTTHQSSVAELISHGLPWVLMDK
jgi:predicted alpha/beta superfamily hydrolase